MADGASYLLAQFLHSLLDRIGTFRHRNSATQQTLAAVSILNSEEKPTAHQPAYIHVRVGVVRCKRSVGRARVLCACAQKVGTSCSHTKLQVARNAQRQSSSATQTSPLLFFLHFFFFLFFVVLFYVCSDFDCVVFIVSFFSFLSASMTGWPKVGPRGPHTLPPKGHGPGKAR